MTASLNSTRSGAFSQCSCRRSGVIWSYRDEWCPHDSTLLAITVFNPLECQGNYNATSNIMRLVHWSFTRSRVGYIFGTARPGPSSLYQMQQPTRQRQTAGCWYGLAATRWSRSSYSTPGPVIAWMGSRVWKGNHLSIEQGTHGVYSS